MKKLLIFLTIVTSCLLLLSGCKTKEKKIVDITLDEFKKKIENKETFPLFIGNDSCSHCISYLPILKKVVEDYDITLYHLDNSKLSEDELSEFNSYINISGTPTVVFITNGEEETTLNRINGEVSREATISRFKTNGYIK